MKTNVISRIFVFLYLTLSPLFLYAQDKEVSLTIVETSDIHGQFFPYDFQTNEQTNGGLSYAYSYIKEKRNLLKNNLILVDNGDILQGQPTTFYYNYVDTVSTHICADIMNYMKYDVGNIGNHEMDAGRKVLKRWMSQCNFPILGANVIDKSTGKPFLKPYEILEREGVKIAILGLTTPVVPIWLPENLWQGLRYDDMEQAARKWMKIIKEKEKPDLIIGLFHSGQHPKTLGKKYRDNTSLETARRIPGFDVVMMGHDHIPECKKIVNNAGDSVLVVNPASHASLLAEVNIKVKLNHGKVTEKYIHGTLIDPKKYESSKEFMEQFRVQYETTLEFLSQKLGTFEETITTRDAYFGSSAFIDFIHYLQLRISNADISFTAPLSYDVKIEKGDITVNDIFLLYKFKNYLYTMRLSGKEIKSYLEESYDLWINQMKSPDDHLLKIGFNNEEQLQFNPFVNCFYFLDSAAGINYTVDATKKKGKRIHIISMENGEPFSLKKDYKVVVNSFRGNGGGGLIEKGAGIPLSKIKQRILATTNKDMQYYLMEYIKKQEYLNPQPMGHWKFIPEEWTIPAAQKNYNILFGSDKK